MASEVEESVQSAIPTILNAVNNSLSSAVSSLPTSKPHGADNVETSILPPADGISLLDTKSEILLSYMQNLVYLILLQVRQLSSPSQQSSGGDENSPSQEDVAKKLTELRVYLERGVRPLEGRLKYQIDKVLKAAEDAEKTRLESSQMKKQNGTKKSKTKKVPNSGSEDDDDEGESADSGSEESDEGGDNDEDEEIDELAYRPNLGAFSRAAENQKKEEAAAAQKHANASSDGIYRPPKIKPTVLPTATSSSRRAEREARRNKQSRVIDDFVNAEMSSAPMAEPSIGSTIRDGGRQVTTQQDRARETERRVYEETNLTRLPKESKKERAKRGGGNRPAGYGGEEWRGLGEGADRIQRLTRTGKGGGGALDRSRKRRATEDGPRGDGINIGEGFEKRRKKVAGWKK